MSRVHLWIGEGIFLIALCIAAFLMFRQHPPVPGAIHADIKLPEPRAQIYIVREPTGGYDCLVSRPGGNVEKLSSEQLIGQLYLSGSAGGLATSMGLTSPIVIFWVSMGLFGQILFTGRMVVQWIASEKQGKSVVPPLFWWMSLIGSLLLLVYFLWRKDPVGLLGQAFGSFIYLKNILWIMEGKRPSQMAETGETVSENT